jgi:chaperonin GroES
LKVKPVGDRILVEKIAEDEQTAGGIFIPDTAKEKPQRGKVLAVGHGSYQNGIHIPCEIRVGEEILFAKYSGNDLKLDGREIVLMHSEDVLAHVVPD